MNPLQLPPLPDIDPLRRVRLRLQARAEETDRQFERLSQSVGQAKARVEDEPEVSAVLEDLQAREHQRAVGDYEQLLTLLLQDVLPGPRQVVLDLRTERGLPALDVFLRKGDNQPLEDALHGTGGSVTNLLSAGLRFIALARSGLRPFLVLDEADCWIKPTLAARFAGVVQQMAEELGVQVLMISHHDDSLFEPVLPHRLHLERGSSGLAAHWAPTADVPQWADEQSGLRSIELVDFQSHRHTVIPLSPGVTLLQGDNDIGKSAVVKALRSVFYAESNETFIRHGSGKARVILDFGPEDILSWERNRKGKVTVSYSLTDRMDGSLKHHSEGARIVPPWVSDFGIAMVDELDVQLGDQHDPVFLLNKRASERAKALAVGDDAGHVQAMLSLSKQELNEARAAVRQGEKTLETLYRMRAALEPLKTRQEQWDTIEHLLLARKQAREQGQSLLELGARWEASSRAAQARAPLADTHTPGLPTLTSTPTAQALLRRWQETSRRRQAMDGVGQTSEIASPQPSVIPQLQALQVRWQEARATMARLGHMAGQEIPTVPELRPALAQGHGLLARWRPASQRVATLRKVMALPPTSLPDEPQRETAGLLKQWKGLQRETVELEQQMAKQQQQASEVQHLLETQFRECPTCHQPLSGAHDHAAPTGA